MLKVFVLTLLVMVAMVVSVVIGAPVMALFFAGMWRLVIHFMAVDFNAAGYSSAVAR